MEEAFTGCAALKDLTVESSTVEFTNWWVDTDEIPSDLTITCPKDSKIAAWAEKNNVASYKEQLKEAEKVLKGLEK